MLTKLNNKQLIYYLYLTLITLLLFFFHFSTANIYGDGCGGGEHFWYKLNQQILKTKSNQNDMAEPEQGRNYSQVFGVFLEKK